MSLTAVDGRTVVTLTFAGSGRWVESGSLANGVWVLQVNARKVKAGGVPMATGTGRIYRPFGDSDGNDADRTRFPCGLGQ